MGKYTEFSAWFANEVGENLKQFVSLLEKAKNASEDQIPDLTKEVKAQLEKEKNFIRGIRQGPEDIASKEEIDNMINNVERTIESIDIYIEADLDILLLKSRLLSILNRSVEFYKLQRSYQ